MKIRYEDRIVRRKKNRETSWRIYAYGGYVCAFIENGVWRMSHVYHTQKSVKQAARLFLNTGEIHPFV
jgi:hypothetical protein